jgi:hypothetical protein
MPLSDTRQRAHFHDKQTEVFHILEGEATITINDIDYLAQPGGAFTRGCGAVPPAMSTIYGIKQTKISDWLSLKSTCRKRGKTVTGRSHLACLGQIRINKPL